MHQGKATGGTSDPTDGPGQDQDKAQAQHLPIQQVAERLVDATLAQYPNDKLALFMQQLVLDNCRSKAMEAELRESISKQDAVIATHIEEQKANNKQKKKPKSRNAPLQSAPSVPMEGASEDTTIHAKECIWFYDEEISCFNRHGITVPPYDDLWQEIPSDPDNVNMANVGPKKPKVKVVVTPQFKTLQKGLVKWMNTKALYQKVSYVAFPFKTHTPTSWTSAIDELQREIEAEFKRLRQDIWVARNQYQVKDGENSYFLYNQAIRESDTQPFFIQGPERLEIKQVQLPNHRKSVAITLHFFGKTSEVKELETWVATKSQAKLVLIDYHPQESSFIKPKVHKKENKKVVTNKKEEEFAGKSERYQRKKSEKPNPNPPPIQLMDIDGSILDPKKVNTGKKGKGQKTKNLPANDQPETVVKLPQLQMDGLTAKQIKQATKLSNKFNKICASATVPAVDKSKKVPKFEEKKQTGPQPTTAPTDVSKGTVEQPASLKGARQDTGRGDGHRAQREQPPEKLNQRGGKTTRGGKRGQGGSRGK